MAFDYSNMLTIAGTQIADKGRNVTYRAVTEGTYDPATNTRTSDTTTDTTIKAVVTDIKLKNIDGNLTQRGDKMLLVAGDSITPDMADKIIDGSVTYQIVFIDEIKTGDTTVLYKLQVRR